MVQRTDVWMLSLPRTPIATVSPSTKIVSSPLFRMSNASPRDPDLPTSAHEIASLGAHGSVE